jgi:uncharacterized membrane protein YfcA
MALTDYGLYFALTLAISTVFAMGGVGSALGLVPVLHMLGIPFDPARALGLFVNTASTLTASVMNFRRGVLEVRTAMPLVLSMLIATPFGAWCGQFVPHIRVHDLMIVFLITSALLMLFTKRVRVVQTPQTWVLFPIGASVGVVSGLLGVGGGMLMMPALILLGFDAKKAARAISFVIPFSSGGAFLTYLGFTTIDWPLLATVALAAIAGGYFGQRIMHTRLGPAQIKKGIAVLLLLLAAKMIRAHFQMVSM